jgi:hypothetical protein
MQPIAFCTRCRGMKVGWNQKYILHYLTCQEWLTKSYKLLILTAVLSSFVFAFPVTTGVVLSDLTAPTIGPSVAASSPAPAGKVETSPAIQDLLARYGVEKERLAEVTQAIMTSAAKYKVDPR